nr:Rnase Y domain-containing protein [Chitinophagales bacterium]
MDIMSVLIGAGGGLLIGLLLGRLFFSKSSAELEQARKDAADMLSAAQKDISLLKEKATTEAENLKKDRLLEAKEKFLQMKAEIETERVSKLGKLEEQELRMKNREKQLAQERENLKKKENEANSVRENLNRQLELVSVKKTELEKAYSEHVAKLEQIAGLTAEQAKTQLVETLKDEARNQAMAHVKEIMEESKLKANKEAKKIILQTIQRTAAEQTIENTVSVFNLDSDDQKGQIIGREGRNIRALEAATGIELIVDDTPETIIISGFDPVRREVARLS